MTSQEETPKNILEEVSAEIGIDASFLIEDGRFIIAPSDAGIMILGALSMAQAREDEAWDEVDKLSTRLEEERERVGDLMDLLESTVDTLRECGATELADRIIDAAYPVSGIRDDGTIVRFGPEGQQ